MDQPLDDLLALLAAADLAPELLRLSDQERAQNVSDKLTALKRQLRGY